MVWFDSIDDLQYYNPPGANVDCYCDLLIEPNDLLLQAEVGPKGPGEYELTVDVMTADGLTVLESGLPYLEWYVFKGINGKYYLNIRFKRFSPQMCVVGCFILHVIMKKVIAFGSGETFIVRKYTLFEGYTERYCVDSCCSLPGNISVVITDPEGADYDAADYDTTDYFAT